MYATSLNMVGVSIPASAAKSFSPSRCLSTAWPKIAWWKEKRRKRYIGERCGGGKRGEVGEERSCVVHYTCTYCISEHTS